MKTNDTIIYTINGQQTCITCVANSNELLFSTRGQRVDHVDGKGVCSVCSETFGGSEYGKSINTIAESLRNT